MSGELLVAVVSAVIAGVFTLISKRMELSRPRDGAKTLPSQGASPTVPVAPGAINYGLVVRQIGILLFIISLAAFLFGIIMGATGASEDSSIIAWLFTGTIVLSAGFFWAALSIERAIRWQHLVVVAIGVAIISLILNSITLQMPLSLASLVLALIQQFVGMGIGGSIANTMKN